jgi:hypothetical protein
MPLACAIDPPPRPIFWKSFRNLAARFPKKNDNPVSASFTMAGTKTRRGSAVFVDREHLTYGHRRGVWLLRSFPGAPYQLSSHYPVGRPRRSAVARNLSPFKNKRIAQVDGLMMGQNRVMADADEEETLMKSNAKICNALLCTNGNDAHEAHNDRYAE